MGNDFRKEKSNSNRLLTVNKTENQQLIWQLQLLLNVGL